MVAIPITYDQPGNAARIAYHGAGEFLDLENLSVEQLRKVVQQVLENVQYRERARWFQAVIAQTRGLDLAANLIEQAFAHQPRPASPAPMSSPPTKSSRRPWTRSLAG
jgi:UDP:flavonoid glycosyltransferase YjiC (YdhE family)